MSTAHPVFAVAGATGTLGRSVVAARGGMPPPPEARRAGPSFDEWFAVR